MDLSEDVVYLIVEDVFDHGDLVTLLRCRAVNRSWNVAFNSLFLRKRKGFSRLILDGFFHFPRGGQIPLWKSSPANWNLFCEFFECGPTPYLRTGWDRQGRPRYDFWKLDEYKAKMFILHHLVLHSFRSDREPAVSIKEFGNNTAAYGKITCARISGEFIYVGHESGTVVAYCATEGRQPFRTAKYKDGTRTRKVLQLGLMDPNKESETSYLFSEKEETYKTLNHSVMVVRLEGGKMDFLDLRPTSKKEPNAGYESLPLTSDFYPMSIVDNVVIFQSNSGPLAGYFFEQDRAAVSAHQFMPANNYFAGHVTKLWPCLLPEQRKRSYKIFSVHDRHTGILQFSEEGGRGINPNLVAVSNPHSSGTITAEQIHPFVLVEPIKEGFFQPGWMLNSEPPFFSGYTNFKHSDPDKQFFRIQNLTEFEDTLSYDINSHNASLVHKAFIFRDDCFIVTTEPARKLLISIDGIRYRAYDQLDAFEGGQVTSALFSGNVLFLGTNNGRLACYPVAELSDLLHLDLKKPQIFYHNENADSVLSIDLNQCRMDADGRDVIKILVAFKNKLVVITKDKVDLY